MNVFKHVFRKLFVFFSVVLFLQVPAFACLWDSDTLMMERQRFPEALELITGKFVRHSDAYYHWRIKDRLEKLKNDPDNLKLQDDLAVAYDKTGQHQKAIDVATQQYEKHPERYETLANLGTFYIHNRQLEEGLVYINKAIEVNPDAHFGREVYQKHLVGYLLTDYKNRVVYDGEYINHSKSISYYDYLKKKRVINNDKEDVKKAIKGVLGMMRFGNYRSPVLLDALGSLLLAGNSSEDAKHLAYRVYIIAARETEDSNLKVYYEEVNHGVPLSLIIDEAVKKFNEELAEAEAWFDKVEADEKRWIEEGVDVDEYFNKKYYKDVKVSAPFLSHFDWILVHITIESVMLVLLFIMLIMGIKSRPKIDRKTYSIKKEYSKLNNGEIPLKTTFWYYYAFGIFTTFFISSFISGFITIYSKVLSVIICVAACFIYIALYKFVWLSGKNSSALWKYLSRIFGIILLLPILYLYWFVLKGFFI